ncbi:hypothetical protein [Chitinophaga agri]|uniref:Uncharacterized protein n=1 Tax=Chitinophaga agri TaxID=2703787 RepID=A0A6B9Z8T5_9BACT|nr:hypothetical protein [Chitinophaga agri]QHS58289.1 hypothetical protein GWR21_01355 [Chitinophaga agri]
MGRSRFLLKLAFICNLCFLIAEASYYIKFEGQAPELLKLILPVGMILAFPLNLLVLLITTIVLWRRKITWAELPPYVFIVNVIILLVQFYFLFR